MKRGWNVGWCWSPSSCLGIICRLNLSPPNCLIDTRSKECLILYITQNQFLQVTSCYYNCTCCTTLIIWYFFSFLSSLDSSDGLCLFISEGYFPFWILKRGGIVSKTPFWLVHVMIFSSASFNINKCVY